MSRLGNPTRQSSLTLEYLDEQDFNGLNIRCYANETNIALAMQKFDSEITNNQATTAKPLALMLHGCFTKAVSFRFSSHAE